GDALHQPEAQVLDLDLLILGLGQLEDEHAVAGVPLVLHALDVEVSTPGLALVRTRRLDREALRRSRLDPRQDWKRRGHQEGAEREDRLVPGQHLAQLARRFSPSCQWLAAA